MVIWYFERNLIFLIKCSIGVRVPALETFAYSTSKAAVHQLTRVLASQLGSRGITVNGIIAGPFPSKMMKQTLKDFKDVIVAGNELLSRKLI